MYLPKQPDFLLTKYCILFSSNYKHNRLHNDISMKDGDDDGNGSPEKL